jgi:hypothetical protein
MDAEIMDGANYKALDLFGDMREKEFGKKQIWRKCGHLQKKPATCLHRKNGLPDE